MAEIDLHTLNTQNLNRRIAMQSLDEVVNGNSTAIDKENKLIGSSLRKCKDNLNNFIRQFKINLTLVGKV